MKLKKMIVWCCVAGVTYFLLTNHFVFIGSKLHILKKSSFTLEDTIFSTQGKSMESILSVDSLRRDGIGRLLVQTGRISEDDLERLTAKIEEAEQERKS